MRATALRRPCVCALWLPFGAPAPFRLPLPGPATKLFARTPQGIAFALAFRRRMTSGFPGVAFGICVSMPAFYPRFGRVR
jgi:hypothetical protein